MKKQTFAFLVLLTLFVVYSGSVYAAWEEYIIDSNFPNACNVVAGDIDGDGDPDIAAVSTDGIVKWYDNTGYLQFTEYTIAEGITNARYLQEGDINNDGSIDFVVACFHNWPAPAGLYWLMNNGAMQFTVIRINSDYRFFDMEVLDLDGDDDLDIVGTYLATFYDKLICWENLNNGQSFIEHTILSSIYSSGCFGSADIDGDGDIDLMTGHSSSIVWLENIENHSFTTHTVGPDPSSLNDVCAADFDMDSDMDIFAGGHYGVTWYHNDGNQNFSRISEIDSPNQADYLKFWDVDGDGCMDFTCYGWNADQIYWIENFLWRDYQNWQLTQPGVSTVSYDTCDLTGNGRIDVVTTGTWYSNRVSWYANTLDPTVKVQVVPLNYPIVIPPEGGEFSFVVHIWNTTSDSLLIDLWTSAESEWGMTHPVEPCILIEDIVLLPDTLLPRQLIQHVPQIVPADEYYYTVKIGEFPHYLIETDGFGFYKDRGNVGNIPDENNLTVYGWNSGNFASDSHSPDKSPISISPNPFNPATTISFELRDAGFVELAVYDVMGREVVRLVDEWTLAGIYQMKFDAAQLSSGVYFACLKAEGFSQTRKLLLIK